MRDHRHSSRTSSRSSQTQTGNARKTIDIRPHHPHRGMGEAKQKKGLCARKCSSVNRAHVSPRTRTHTRTEIGRESDGNREGRERETRETPKWAQRPTHRHTKTHTHTPKTQGHTAGNTHPQAAPEAAGFCFPPLRPSGERAAHVHTGRPVL